MAGRPLVAWSLDALAAAECVGGVVIAGPLGLEEELQQLAGDAARVVAGGTSRSASVASALEEVETDLVVIHDAARPLATAALFDAIVGALIEDPRCDALISAVPLADTVRRARGDLAVTEIVDREGLWRIQTPQAFRTEVLSRALEAPAAELAAATDDAMLVEAAGGTVRLYPVAEPNPKVTTPADLVVAEALLRR